MSDFPSPSMSPNATLYGDPPAVKSTGPAILVVEILPHVNVTENGFELAAIKFFAVFVTIIGK